MRAVPSYAGRHRRVGTPVVAAYPADFIPTHCTGVDARGGTCIHPHPGEPAWDTFPGLDVADATRCDRTGVHGPHDVTEDGVDRRCPGVRDQLLPGPHVDRRAAQARAAIGGGRR